MKRESIAETTLRKQIKILESKREVIVQARKRLANEGLVYFNMIQELEAEVERLRAIREAASRRNRNV
jgi:hypothetical protein